MDTGRSQEDLPKAMDDRDEWREKSLLAAQNDDEIYTVIVIVEGN